MITLNSIIIILDSILSQTPTIILNPDLTNNGQNAYFWTGQGCVWVPARVSADLGAKFLKIESFFFSFSLQKHEKFQNSKNRLFWRPAESIRRDPAFISGLCFVQN
jgi:hypothetical protein